MTCYKLNDDLATYKNNRNEFFHNYMEMKNLVKEFILRTMEDHDREDVHSSYPILINPFEIDGCLILTHNPKTNPNISAEEFVLVSDILSILISGFCSQFLSNKMLKNGIFEKDGVCYSYKKGAYKRLVKLLKGKKNED